jgi:hypothetical protein
MPLHGKFVKVQEKTTIQHNQPVHATPVEVSTDSGKASMCVPRTVDYSRYEKHQSRIILFETSLFMRPGRSHPDFFASNMRKYSPEKGLRDFSDALVGERNIPKVLKKHLVLKRETSLSYT